MLYISIETIVGEIGYTSWDNKIFVTLERADQEEEVTSREAEERDFLHLNPTKTAHVNSVTLCK